MDMGGICQVCESRPANYTCDSCGAYVCESHFEKERGICADCAGTAQKGTGPDFQP